MKLYEFKAKYISRLGSYTPKNKREKEIIEIIINKVYNLRVMTLPNLAHTLYLAIYKEPISEELKKIFMEMLSDIQNIEGE